MSEICPSCRKNDFQAKIKLFQINNSLAVFLCSNEECLWPFDHEDFIFIHRPKEGKNWKEDWEMKEREYLQEKEWSNDNQGIIFSEDSDILDSDILDLDISLDDLLYDDI